MTTTPNATPRALYVMIGGFLGAGKTTTVGRLARWLTDRGRRVGLITNDQGQQLVDTTLLRARGFAVEEIPGGCFCCRFNSLVEAACRLTAATRPEVFIAEPVGSCTDLVATVTYPLRQLYGEGYAIAPLSVLVDPIRARRVLGLERGGQFTQKVLYIYRKQLEEADLIVVNKSDLVDAARRAELREVLAGEFPRARLIEVSAREGTGLDEWFAELLTSTQGSRPAMEVDYDRYAEGEALLGWLNATIRLTHPTAFDGNQLVHDLAATIQRGLNERGAEVAHLKMTLDPGNPFGELAAVNLVRNDFVPELSQRLSQAVEQADLTVNLRAEDEPDQLAATLHAALQRLETTHAGLTIEMRHREHFRPGKPQPTHRVSTLA